jgi:aryl-alcohol dehydrogenase-like predicted oxidoreductase
METRRLGRTEHQSSIAILGGAVFFKDSPETAEVFFHEAINAGINHLDIAPGYGLAERAVGPHLQKVREKIFVADKTGEIEESWAKKRLEKTLTRLQVDYLDLYQAHGVTSVEELDKRSEAFEVILDAKEQGLTRFIGITGHDLGAPKAHLEAIRRYDVDTVMLPIYPRVWADPVYRADTEKLFAECADRDVGVMAIKAVAWRPWGERQPDAMSWYEPQRTKSEIERGINFALSTPGVHCFCTPSDLNTARLAIENARNFISLTENEHAAVIEEVRTDELIFPLSEHAVPLGKNIGGSQPLSGN